MLVIKFGGASVATPESFLKIADLIIERSHNEAQIVVVVSAMGDTTDQLFQLAHQVHPNPPHRELDMLVSAGERISIALLAMALAAKGKEAVSFTGSQSGIITTECHSEANIVDIRPQRLQAVLRQGKIPIVAGFQGVSRKGEITTLGRGGSDTTAVAIAVALGSPRVVFYKDVPGIFEVDPKLDPKARHFPCLSYSDAMAMAAKGSQILHSRSIAMAEKNGIQLQVCSFHDLGGNGTVIGVNAMRNKQLIFEIESEHVG